MSTSNPAKVTLTSTVSSRTTIGNPAVVEWGGRHPHQLRVDDHELPYIEVLEWPEGGIASHEREMFAAQLDDQAPELASAVRAGEPIYSLLCDGRFGVTAAKSEIERWAWFLANAMAVSAGYTSHGKGSRPINRHGP